jgi:hypothetical protein
MSKIIDEFEHFVLALIDRTVLGYTFYILQYVCIQIKMVLKYLVLMSYKMVVTYLILKISESVYY